MNENEKWLADRIIRGPVLDENECLYIAKLSEESISEADLSSCIDVVEALLSLGALAPLLAILKSGARSISLRKQAAKAISVIGASYIETELLSLRNTQSSDLRLLADIALS